MKIAHLLQGMELGGNLKRPPRHHCKANNRDHNRVLHDQQASPLHAHVVADIPARQKLAFPDFVDEKLRRVSGIYELRARFPKHTHSRTPNLLRGCDPRPFFCFVAHRALNQRLSRSSLEIFSECCWNNLDGTQAGATRIPLAEVPHASFSHAAKKQSCAITTSTQINPSISFPLRRFHARTAQSRLSVKMTSTTAGTLSSRRGANARQVQIQNL